VDPLAALLELRDACAAGRAPAPNVAAWFAAGIDRARARGERLDAALGLAGAGRRSIRSRLTLLERDRHLIAAAEATTMREAPAWEQARRLAPLAAAMERDRARRRLPLEPEPSWPGWKLHLWHAARCGPLPQSPEQLWRLLERGAFRAEAVR